MSWTLLPNVHMIMIPSGLLLVVFFTGRVCIPYSLNLSLYTKCLSTLL